MVRALEKGLFEPVRSGTKDSGWWHGDDYLFLHLKMSSCGCPVVPEVPLSCRGQGRRQRSAQLGPAGRARSLSCPLMGSTPAATSELHDRSGRCYKCWSQRKWPWPESANSNANSTQTQKTQCKLKKKIQMSAVPQGDLCVGENHPQGVRVVRYDSTLTPICTWLLWPWWVQLDHELLQRPHLSPRLWRLVWRQPGCFLGHFPSWLTS